MPALTRRRSPDAQQETWLVYYGDVHVGRSLSALACLLVPTNGAGRALGFYPASHRGVRARGTAKSFDAARATPETAWHWLLPKLTESDFTEYRLQRAME
jgi:hypothetical protein